MAVFKVQNRWASPDERPAVCQEGCRTGFKSWQDRSSLHSGSWNNWRKCAAFEMTPANSLACSRLLDSRGRWIENARTRKQNGRKLGRAGASFSLFPTPPTFRVPFTFASSPLSESLEEEVFRSQPQPNPCSCKNSVRIPLLWDVEQPVHKDCRGRSATSLKVTDLLFGFTLCEKKQKTKNKKQKNRREKLLTSLVGDYRLLNLPSFSDLQSNKQTTEPQSVFVILCFIWFIGQLSMQGKISM